MAPRQGHPELRVQMGDRAVLESKPTWGELSTLCNQINLGWLQLRRDKIRERHIAVAGGERRNSDFAFLL